MKGIRATGAWLVLALVAACGGGQTNVEKKPVVEAPAIQDIPGVQRAAVKAFNDGIDAMKKQPVDYETAVASFERAVEIDENFWEAWENLGLLHMDLGRYAEAIAAFERELAIIEDVQTRDWPVDDRPEILLNIGKAYALAGQTDKAAASFGKLVQEDAENTDALANLAALFVQQKNYDQARAYIGQILQISQNDVGALNVLARIYKDENNVQMAEYLWEKCVEEIAIKRDGLDDEEQFKGLSEADAEKLRSFNRRKSDVYTRQLSDVQNELGIFALQQGESDRAERLFRDAVTNNPFNWAARINLGAVYLDYAFFEDACEEFSEALALRPRNLPALVGQSSCLYGAGEVEEAYAQFEKTLQFHPNHAYTAQRLGDLAFQDLNDQNAAIRWYSRNLEIRGQSPTGCNPATDKVCAALQSLIQMQKMNEPREPSPSE